MATATTTYGELINGDIVHIQGYRFTVVNIRVARKAGERDTMHGEPLRADVIRFEGACADQSSISKTSYNGGTYGAYADVPCTIEAR